MLPVAPYVGAWIETHDPPFGAPLCMSHPTWVRGLKRVMMDNSLGAALVAPYVGAWIETIQQASFPSVNSSHPTWVRGLKLILMIFIYKCLLSHPTWVRGLKLGKII